MTKKLALLSVIFVGCATVEQSSTTQSPPSRPIDVQTVDDSIFRSQSAALSKIQIPEKEPITITESVVVRKPRIKYEMDTKNHLPKVRKWIKYYSQKDRKRFQRFLNRGAQYKQVIQDLLISEGLPPDLYFLGILESGYQTGAVSHAGAVGPWQFMAPTARQYGLKINNYVDERVDPIRSTISAIKYLKELYRQKKTWPLALAAYNAGPGRVRRAMRRGGSRNYWKLTRRRLLPYDTREYIPQFLAMVTIGKNLEKYGFVEKAKNIFQKRELVSLPAPIRLSDVAQMTGGRLEDLKAMNPHFNNQISPPTKSQTYGVWIPKELVAKAIAVKPQLVAKRIKGLKLRKRSRIARGGRYHRVRKGQNLSRIARRYGTSVRKLKRLNRLRTSRIFAGQRLKVSGGRTRSKSVSSKAYHRVRRGDNLTRIARRYGVSAKQLQRANGLRGSKIFVGQKLYLKRQLAKKKSVKRYKIRSGDNLAKIAKRFGISIRQLKRLNGLKSSKILRGQTLIVR